MSVEMYRNTDYEHNYDYYLVLRHLHLYGFPVSVGTLYDQYSFHTTTIVTTILGKSFSGITNGSVQVKLTR
ncbi:putative CiV12g5 protein [Bracoviriform inaniti]|uniref:Putative CiV12g5 protein n=1 Tax=Bracoviriform inaniti TaxID=36344 RepID=D5MCR6_9VIRU|nr:putative CiV12g5 protein [Bracoviriform inaniti]CBL51507.1 putative CiV12g5 protein [Bracoviriform inaniti]